MPLSKDEITNLSQLFLSKDDTNTQLAFEIMEPHGFAVELLTEIFVVYKLTSSNELRQRATALLEQHGSSSIKAAMARKLEFNTEKTIKKNISKYVQTSNDELDGLKFAEALYNKYGLGFAYLMKEASSEAKKAILEKHKEGTTFTLHYKGLTAMPKEFFEFTDLEEIDISHNKISNLSGKFKAFKNLRKLNAASNCIKKIHKNFASLQHLEELDLSSNLIEEFPTVLGDIKSLRRLDMRSMLNIKSLVRGVTIPDNFFNLQLHFLGLSSDSANGYKHGFSNFPYLNTLETTDGTFINLDPLAMAKVAFEAGQTAPVYYLLYHADSAYRKKVLERFYDAATQTMDLSDMYIKNLPEELGEFDIRILNLNESSIGYNFHFIDDNNELFAAITQLVNLEELYLQRNGLSELPLPIFECTKLRIIDASKNMSLYKIPPQIGQLTALEHINLDGTSSGNFIDFPDEIKTLQQLKTIKLNYVSWKTDEEVAAYKQRVADLFGERVALNLYGLKKIDA